MKSKKSIISIVALVLILMISAGCTRKKAENPAETNINVQTGLSEESSTQESEIVTETAETSAVIESESETVPVETMEIEEDEDVELEDGEATVGM